MKRELIKCGIVIMLFFLLVPIAEGQVKKLDWDNPIKIGYLNPFNQPNSDLPGVLLAIEEINAAGGVLGRPLEVLPRDTKFNPERSLREAKDLLFNQKVFYIHGTTSSSVARAVSDFCKINKTIFYISTATSDKLLGEWGHRYVFTQNPNSYMESLVLAKGCVENFGRLKKVYNLSPDYEGGRTAWQNFIDYYKKLVPNAEVVGNVWPKLGTMEYTPYLTAIANSDAELIFSAFYQTDALTMIKQSTIIGLNGKIPTAGLWWNSADIASMFTEKVWPKNTLGGGAYAFWEINKPASLEFVQKIKSKWGTYPYQAVMSYSWVKALASAINKVGALDTEKIIDLMAGATIDTPIGPIEMRSCDHQGLWPYWVGMISYLPDWGFYGSKNSFVGGKEYYHTCEEIAKKRTK